MSESRYRYELDELDTSIDALRAMLPPSELLYSMKANGHPAVVGRCVERGLAIEVSSHGELLQALRDGARGSSVVCTGPGKSDAYLRLACESSSVVSVESAQEVERLNRDLAGSPTSVLVRVNASRTSGRARLQMTGVASQFGVDEEDAQSVVAAVVDGPHTFAGVHLYMGSNLDDEDALVDQFEIGVEVATAFESYASSRYVVDLGGGFGHPFARHGDRPVWPGLRARLERLVEPHPGWDLAFESGRYIASACGTLTMTVRETKYSRGVRYAVASSGVNHLGGLSGLRRIPPVRPDVDGGNPTADDGLTRLVGPLCTPVDVLNPKLETAPRLGDTLTVPNVGAYGLNASLANFLGHDYPVEEVTRSGVTTSLTQLSLSRNEVSA